MSYSASALNTDSPLVARWRMWDLSTSQNVSTYLQMPSSAYGSFNRTSSLSSADPAGPQACSILLLLAARWFVLVTLTPE